MHTRVATSTRKSAQDQQDLHTISLYHMTRTSEESCAHVCTTALLQAAVAASTRKSAQDQRDRRELEEMEEQLKAAAEEVLMAGRCCVHGGPRCMHMPLRMLLVERCG